MTAKGIFTASYFDVRKIPSDNRRQIAFAGRSNVGKSALLNCLVGQKKLARISKTPGRTQSLNFFLIDDLYYFVDLPGYGFARAPLKQKEEWGKLVDNYINNVDMLCGLVFLLDCRREPNEDDLLMIDWMEKKSIKYLPVLTKADKLSRVKLIEQVKEIEKLLRISPIPFSIISGTGVKEVWKWIERVAKG